VNTAWALGLIVGPALGGYLSQVPVQKESKTKEKEKCLLFLLQYSFFFSQPTEKYPHIFSKDSVFGR
jgi:hypothetical protein